MAVQHIEKLYTADDYFAMPGEDPRYELLEGELIELTPSPTSVHQRILFKLARLLEMHCETQRLGEILIAPLDVVLSPRTVVQPDIIFIAQKRREQLIGDHITGAPDLVIEILSPATGARDLNQKRKLYARSGVKEYWIVDPEDETIEIQQLHGKVFSTLAIFEKSQKLTSPTLKGLAVEVEQIFAN